jgi:hypothetical protein
VNRSRMNETHSVRNGQARNHAVPTSRNVASADVTQDSAQGARRITKLKFSRGNCRGLYCERNDIAASPDQPSRLVEGWRQVCIDTCLLARNADCKLPHSETARSNSKGDLVQVEIPRFQTCRELTGSIGRAAGQSELTNSTRGLSKLPMRPVAA